MELWTNLGCRLCRLRAIRESAARPPQCLGRFPRPTVAGDVAVRLRTATPHRASPFCRRSRSMALHPLPLRSETPGRFHEALRRRAHRGRIDPAPEPGGSPSRPPPTSWPPAPARSSANRRVRRRTPSIDCRRAAQYRALQNSPAARRAARPTDVRRSATARRATAGNSDSGGRGARSANPLAAAGGDRVGDANDVQILGTCMGVQFHSAPLGK